MTKIEVISIIAKEKMVETIVHNIAKKEDDLNNDLIQEIYLNLLEKNDDLIVNLYASNQIHFFITRMVLNQLHSTNSPFYMRFKRFTLNMEQLGDYENE